jgi:hypothetical protein
VLTHLLLEFGATAILNDHGANTGAGLGVCESKPPMVVQ